MQFTMEAGGIPAGVYRASFIGVEIYNENADRFGQGVKLRFRVVDGPHANSETSRICSAKMTTGSALGKFAVALAGGQLSPGQSFDFAQHVNATGMIIVEATQAGGSRVASFQRDTPPTTLVHQQQGGQHAAPQTQAKQQETF